jgi:hypothetical protein
MNAAAVRAFPLLRAGYAVVLLCVPSALIGVCTGQPASKADRRVARVLGARHLVQAVLTARSPSPAVLGLGALVDVLHSASMLALGAANRPMRNAEFADGLIAASFAVAGTALTATSTPPQRTPEDS